MASITKKDLLEKAKTHNPPIVGMWKMSKDELIEAMKKKSSNKKII